MTMEYKKGYNQMSDADLVQALSLDREAFSELVKRYEPRARNVIRRYLYKNPEVIDDVLQETFIRVYRFINSYDKNSSFVSWVCRIARNESYRYLKKHKNDSIPESELINKEDDGEFLDKIATNERFQVTDEFGVEKVLSKISKKYQTALILRYYEDLSYQEISESLRIPINTVGTLINRAKKEFKKVGQKYGLDLYNNE